MTKLATKQMKMSDTQLVIMSAAARRRSRELIPYPKSLKAKDAALTKSLKQLMRFGFVEKRPAPANGAVWRRDDEERPVGLFLTDAGLAALDVPAVRSNTTKSPAKEKSSKKNGTEPGSSRTRIQTTTGTRRRKSKQDMVVGLLRRKGGATLTDICSQTGWQPHSARGFLSGTVRKKLGLELRSENDKNGTKHYRLDKSPQGQ